MSEEKRFLQNRWGSGKRIKIGIVGATGYTGLELMRILLRHPFADLRVVTSRQLAGKAIYDEFYALRAQTDLCFSQPDTDELKGCDAVFFATPHGVAMRQAPELLQAGVKVFDLSADFRLKDLSLWQHWYKMEHCAPDWVEKAVYGLPELWREELKNARLVACAGCYPTAVQLGFAPLLRAGLLENDSLIADVKSGVSGAGREAKVANLMAEAGDSFKAYAASGHRHLPEIEQGLRRQAGAEVSVCFVPHLLPMIRGIEAGLYARLRDTDCDIQDLYEKAYSDEPFVDVMPPGSHPDTRSVRGSNQLRIALHRPLNRRTVVISVVEDNLVKGAAGQAVQCMNLAFALDETCGLENIALVP